VWRAPDPAAFEREFQKIPNAYVADGHHRSASAARVGQEIKASNPRHSGHEEYNWFLSVLFPADQLKILPYNRLVADLRGLSAEEFLEEVSRIFEVRPVDSPVPEGPGSAAMYLAGRWHALRWEVDASAPPAGRLDVSILQERLLAPVLGILDPRSDARVDFVGGIRGTAELERRVNEGRAAVAFSMSPVTVDQLMDIADAGEIMPPKSTWFEPKLRSGLFIHTFGGPG
ncbi:MAG: DUF1015 family protein, partial [Terrimicrobiaceae bacterium]|nr:DUF1015 family protein [Terrimicrobiaceae bacterium]